MSKYIRLMDGAKSNAGGFEIELNKEVEADSWNPKTYDPTQMRGFNFSADEKILRWIHRGDTIYDVELSSDAEVIDCPSLNCPHGVFRSNKIILKNSRIVEESMVMDFYKKSDLSNNTYYQFLVILSVFKNYISVAEQIIKDRINKDNINECISEFERFVTDKRDGKEHIFNYNDLPDNGKKYMICYLI